MLLDTMHYSHSPQHVGSSQPRLFLDELYSVSGRESLELDPSDSKNSTEGEAAALIRARLTSNALDGTAAQLVKQAISSDSI